jgi:large subunit ribosomal protein L25
MASTNPFVALAKTLPAPLQRFLARYPPAAILPSVAAGAEAPRTGYQLDRPDPFKFWKHPVTLKWQEPVYSLRRQAQLVKIAQEHGVAELLPESQKSPATRLAKRVEHGLRVKGTGVGQKVKGHKEEKASLKKCVPVPRGRAACLLRNKDADRRLQDAAKEASHACNAKAYQDMETGMLSLLTIFAIFDCSCRMLEIADSK